MSGRIWLQPEVLQAIHEAQLAEHGGAAGVRDRGWFESTIARPRHLDAYGLPDGSAPDIADLAAAYGFGLSRNHPFIDGNKRTGFVAVELFLALNGWGLNADDPACVLTMWSLTAGELSESGFAHWLRAHAIRSS